MSDKFFTGDEFDTFLYLAKRASLDQLRASIRKHYRAKVGITAKPEIEQEYINNSMKRILKLMNSKYQDLT